MCPRGNEQPRSMSPTSVLLATLMPLKASNHGAISSQIPIIAFTIRSARVISHAAINAQLAARGPAMRSFVRAAPTYPRTAGAAMSHRPKMRLMIRGNIWFQSPECAPKKVPPRELSFKMLQAGHDFIHHRSNKVYRNSRGSQAQRAPSIQKRRLKNHQHNTHEGERGNCQTIENHKPRLHAPPFIAACPAQPRFDQIAECAERGIRNRQSTHQLGVKNILAPGAEKRFPNGRENSQLIKR